MGGAETYARVLAEGLAAHGDEVTVLTDGTRTVTLSGTEGGVHVERLTAFALALDDRSKLLWEQMAFALTEDIATVMGRQPPELVISNSNDTAALGRMIGDTLGIPVFGAFHEQEPERGPLGPGRARLVYHRLALDGYLAGSEFYADKAIRFGAPATRVHHIPHGVDTELFSPGPARAPGGAFRITLSGRIAPRKQQHLAVEVTRRLRHERGRDVELVLAGRPHSSTVQYAEQVRADIAKADVAAHVHLLEDLGLHDMPAVYRASDLVVQPSLAEGLGLAVLEAMACARPVVVSDASGLREVIRSVQHGIRVDPGHVDAWVDVIEHLIDHPDEASTIARNGRELVLQRFTRDRMIADTRRVLAALVESWAYPRGSEYA
jgi:glycosyltransferase involved in cell wall biosynthesis